ncbi:hypothetical protein ACDZ29_06735 [Peribacillus sp. RS7]|jgi:hypothetical protein|uniref:hypothetical protein n=1 Tax=Peribacillus sp. RS7 TaxID=3242679 RepID=UPI0035BF4195
MTKWSRRNDSKQSGLINGSPTGPNISVTVEEIADMVIFASTTGVIMLNGTIVNCAGGEIFSIRPPLLYVYGGPPIWWSFLSWLAEKLRDIPLAICGKNR